MATGDRKIRDHDFPKKRPGCLEMTGLVTTIWVLSLPETMQRVFTQRLLASGVFSRSINVLGWQRGPAKSREKRFYDKKVLKFFNIHRTIDIHMGTVAP